MKCIVYVCMNMYITIGIAFEFFLGASMMFISEIEIIHERTHTHIGTLCLHLKDMHLRSSEMTRL